MHLQHRVLPKSVPLPTIWRSSPFKEMELSALVSSPTSLRVIEAISSRSGRLNDELDYAVVLKVRHAYLPVICGCLFRFIQALIDP